MTYFGNLNNPYCAHYVLKPLNFRSEHKGEAVSDFIFQFLARQLDWGLSKITVESNEFTPYSKNSNYGQKVA